MGLCDDGHDEIVWNDDTIRKCPACVLMGERDDYERQLDDAKERINVTRVKRYIEEYEQGIIQLLCRKCNCVKGRPELVE